MTTTPLRDNFKATVGASDWLVHTILILWNVISLGSLIASLPERLRRRPIDSDLTYDPSIVPMMFINPILGVLLPVNRARLQYRALKATATSSLSSFSPLTCLSQVVAFGLLSASMYDRVKRTHPEWKIVIELQPYRWFEVGYLWGPYAVCAAAQSWILIYYLRGSY